MSEPDNSKLVGTTAPIERLTYTVDEVCQLLGISRNHGFEAVRQNRIPHLKIGKRILIPRVAVERMLSDACEVKAEQSTAA